MTLSKTSLIPLLILSLFFLPSILAFNILDFEKTTGLNLRYHHQASGACNASQYILIGDFILRSIDNTTLPTYYEVKNWNSDIIKGFKCYVSNNDAGSSPIGSFNYNNFCVFAHTGLASQADDNSICPIGDNMVSSGLFQSGNTLGGNYNQYFDIKLNDTYYVSAGNLVTRNKLSISATRYLFFNNVDLTGNYSFNDTVTSSFIFNRLVIDKRITGSSYQDINNITFEYYPLSDNELPTFNVSFNDRLCFNETEEEMKINLNISTYDAESDTLYYANDYIKNSAVNTTISYNTRLIGNLLDMPDYSSLRNQYNDGSYCYAIKGPLINFSKFMLTELTYYTVPLIDRSKFMLALSSTCVGKTEYVYTLPNSYTNVYYTTRIYGMQSDNEATNITFYDAQLDKNFILRHEVDGSIIKILNWNGSVFRHLGNFTIPSLETPVEFQIYNYGNQTQYTIKSINKGVSYDAVGISTGETKYIGISTENGVIYQRDFTYSGITPVLNFKTTQWQDFNVSGSGTYSIDFYLSDSAHQPTTYTKKTYTLFVPDCRYYVEAATAGDDYTEALENADFIGFFNAFLGKPFRNYLNVADTTNWGSKFIWWLYLFIFLGLFMFNFFNQKSADLIMPLIVSSIAVLMVSLLAGYTASLIVSLILLAFGFGIPLSSSFGGQNGR